jgi:hypothetical protein
MRNYAGTVMMLVTTMVAAVGSYTINLRVSGERAEVEALRNQLVADAREMRNLQAELRTRARFPELQRWNDNVLQMSAPAAGQFLRSPLELASYAAAPAAPAAPSPGVVYAVTAPDVATPVTAPLVEVAYREAPAPAARLIRAGYVVPQRMPAPTVEFVPSRPVPVLAETQRPERPQRPQRPQLARQEVRRVVLASEVSRPEPRKAEPRKPEPRKVAPTMEESPRALGAPIDLLPQGGQ